MPDVPEKREEDTWFTDEQLSIVARADESGLPRSAIPTCMVSNGEYLPARQTREQKEVEARLAELADDASRKLGVSRRRFLASSGGIAASFLAMNQVFGRLFNVNPLELVDPAAAAELGPPDDLFVLDDQLHMVRDRSTSGPSLRALAQGPGPASTAAGFTSNPFNAMGFPDELGNPWEAWTPSLDQIPNVQSDFTLVQFVKDVFLDSNVTVGLLSNAPLGLFVPPGQSTGIVPRTIPESQAGELLTAFQTVAVRDFVNRIAGSQRMLAHGQLYPGVANLDYMQYQIDHYHPDSWKGYTTAFSAKNTDDPTQPMERWRLDDENVAYPTYELIVKNREQLNTRPGFFNICIHKGLSTSDPSNPANDVPFFNADDVPKAASDWPDLNFIIYHSAWAPSFFGYPSLQDLQSGALRDGVPDIKWSTRFAQACAGHPNVYAELGSTFAATVTTFPSVWAHLIGQFLKYFGPERIVFGTDSLWYGAPQWQIEAFWRYQIPEEIATQYKYPQLTEQDKRLILGWNSARLYGLRAKAPVSLSNLYRPVPADYEAQIPSNLKASLADEPGFEEGFLLPNDGLSKLKRDYATAGGRRENLRFGWIRRA